MATAAPRLANSSSLKVHTFLAVSFAAIFLALPLALSQPKAEASPRDAFSVQEVTVQVSPEAADARMDQKVEPEYPSKALNAGTQGDVVLDVLIGNNGKVKDISVTSGEPLLAHAAVKAVKHWRYEPWASGGNNLETRATVTVHFVVRKVGTSIDCPGQNGAKYSFSPNEGGHSPTQENSEDRRYAVFKVGQGVMAPRASYAPDPEYSEKARRSKKQGTDLMEVVITPEGNVARIRLKKMVGYGLDQKAMDAVCNWKFIPATKDGNPVAVLIDIEVSFRLY